MGSLQELQKSLRQKDERIRELLAQLQERDDQIQELRSQLDKYQSILPTSPTAAFGNPFQAGPRKQRGVGISAEPAAQLNFADLSSKSFKTYPKVQR